MCGIAGYIKKSNEYKISTETIKKMTDKMIHRGPDAEGQWTDEKVALGHRRLSIIDLDEKSNQPMVSHDGKYVITFNGEIYNYIELKKELSAKGAVFKTNGDTEVIIEAYRKYGVHCFNKFNGMWAFALYDIEQKKVILCRDRFGIKPLYTLNNPEIFAFASEMKAMVAAFPEENIPNETWIYRYLSYSKQEDSDKECFYKNIKNFPPAYYMIYDLTRHTKKYEKYWRVDEKVFYRRWIKGKNPIKTFRRLFESAVGLRLRADVEVGACLSGGLDSSLIVGCVSKKYGKRIHTFSSVYEDEECNEEMFIEKVNTKWNTIPHYIKPDNYETDFIKYIEDITYYHDQPTLDASLYSQYMVIKDSQDYVKVLLDGQGADELFAGYVPAYLIYYIDDLAEKNTFWSKRQALKILIKLKKEWPQMLKSISTDTIIKVTGIKNSFIFQSQNDKNKRKNNRKISFVFSDEFLNKVDDKKGKKEMWLSSHLNTKLWKDIRSDSIPYILHNEDRNAMTFSIESRVPFLDYRIVEFALALDGKYKIRNNWTKWIIRKSCKDYLPRKVLKRKNKMGFPAPFARWLREGESKDEIKKIIYEFGNRNIVSKKTIDQLYKAHISGKADYNQILFRFLSLELWLGMCEKQRKEVRL